MTPREHAITAAGLFGIIALGVICLAIIARDRDDCSRRGGRFFCSRLSGCVCLEVRP